MIFQHTWRWILRPSPNTKELKTQTRRLIKGQQVVGYRKRVTGFEMVNGVVNTESLTVEHEYTRVCQYKVGQTYAVQPGRGKRAIWWRETADGIETTADSDIYKHWAWKALRNAGFKELRIRITEIRLEDVRNISNADVRAEGFRSEGEFFMTWCRMHDKEQPLPVIPAYVTGAIEWHGAHDELALRPDERYAAWAITFEVVR